MKGSRRVVAAAIVVSVAIGGDARGRKVSMARNGREADAATSDDPSPRCNSIRPGPMKIIGMMLAEAGQQREGMHGPFVPERSADENATRAAAFWAHGVTAEPPGIGGVARWRRLADGERLVVIPGMSFETGIPARLRSGVAPVVVSTICPAHVIRLSEGTELAPSMVLRDPDPAHVVSIATFAIDETEVTWGQFEAFRKKVPRCAKPHRQDWATDRHPVTKVTWYEAAAYCDWVGGRLPTDAEWEYAARGPQGFAFPWGDSLPPPPHALNFGDASLARALCEPSRGLDDDGFVFTAPVGSFPAGASPFGILDMLGNASEWVADWSEDVDLTCRPVEQPCPPSKRDTRSKVQRGGSFWSPSPSLERGAAWSRSGDFPWTRSQDMEVGFRCAHDVPAAP